jgi:hypothetical protein
MNEYAKGSRSPHSRVKVLVVSGGLPNLGECIREVKFLLRRFDLRSQQNNALLYLHCSPIPGSPIFLSGNSCVMVS